MKNIKYIVLGLILTSFANIAAYAEDPALPKLELPGDNDPILNDEESSLDPLLEISTSDSPSVAKPKEQDSIANPNPLLSGNSKTGEKKEILDKAIKEVFEEPKKDAVKAETKENHETTVDDVTVTATGSSDSETPPEVPAEAPKVDEAADPFMEDPLLDSPQDTKQAEKPEPKNEDIIVSPATVTPAETFPAIAEPAIISEPKKEAKPEKAEKAEPEVKTEEKAAVAPEKFKQKKAKAKTTPKKQVVFPKKTPRSLREDYLQPHPNNSTYIEVPANNSYPANMPNATPSGFPPNTRPINDVNTPALTPVPVPSRKLPNSFKQGALEEDELDVIQEFPSKKKVLEVKEDISIDRGDFSDPFGGSSNTTGSKSSDALLETPYKNVKEGNTQNSQTSDAPVVDFSDTSSLEDISAQQEGSKPQNFYMEETGLQVEVKDAPKNSLNIMKNAYEALQVGQYESAIRYYSEALEQNPSNKKAMFGIATAYHMSKDYEKAKETYLKIIKLDPDYWPAVNNYIILVTEENPEKSITRLEELYARNPSFAAIPAQLGNLYYKNGNIQKSVEYYVSAIKLEPKNIEYRYNLALILEKTSRREEAAGLYKSLLDDAAKGAQLPENPVSIKDRYDQLLSKQS